MNRKHLRVGVIVVLLVMMLIAVAPLLAASAANFHWVFVSLNPNCSGTAVVYFDYFDAVSNYQLFMNVYGDGNFLRSFSTSGSPTSGDGYTVHPWLFSGGPGYYSTCGITHDLYIDGVYMASLVYGDVLTGSSSNGPWFYTQPAAGELVTANHQSVLYGGVEACGVFEAGWYGRKYLTPENFPACAGYLPDGVDVACMNEEAVWTTDNVTGSGVSEGVFYAIVQQHGTCGIFPAG